MLKFIVAIVLFAGLFSCADQVESKNPYATFFYPFQEEAKFYVYRDVAQGLNEKFFRIYSIEDSKGKHIVVESYAQDGRITEALNYNLDSLTILDHMVVDRNGEQTKAVLMKNGMFPMSDRQQTWFASKFPGFLDSTLMLAETKRSFDQSSPFKFNVMGEAKNTVSFKDTIRYTQFNPFNHKENSQMLIVKSYFSEGLGLTRFHDLDKKMDYQLEKILTEEEWIKLMQR
jgi:hypothetical protein